MNDAPQTDQRDLDMLLRLVERLYQDIMVGAEKAKVGDFLKALELKRKLAATDQTSAKLWRMIARLRKEEIPYDSSAPSEETSQNTSENTSDTQLDPHIEEHDNH